MVRAFNPDKTSKAELINKMFTLFTVIHCILNDPSLRRASMCVHVHSRASTLYPGVAR